MTEELKDLGCANGWKDTPEIVKKCEAQGHIKFGKQIGKCLHEYKCGACKYSFVIDSSG